MTRTLRLSALALLACNLGCQAIASIEEKQPTFTVDLELCRDYCETVTKNCTGDYQVYHDEDQCMSACRKLPAHPVKGSKNSVECRYQQASSISSEEITCAAAGPGSGSQTGDNICGTVCENYCWLMSQACGESAYRGYWLGDLDKCNAACKGLRDRSEYPEEGDSPGLYSAADDDAQDHTGDTVQCRLFHAVVATAPGAANDHCWHAALSPLVLPRLAGTNPCRGDPKKNNEPRCDAYCRLVTVACTGAQKVYEDEKQCKAGCEAAFELGNVTDARTPETTTPPKNTLGCRLTHAYNALVSTPEIAKLHCGHASPSGDGTCGEICEAYCDQLFKTCSKENDKRDMEQCRNDCDASLDPASVKPYSLKLAKSDKSKLACRFAALTEARAAASENSESARVNKCMVAAGRLPPCM